MAALEGKKALVTGGARRIGRALCLALAEAGCDVVVHYHASKSQADGLAHVIARRYGRRAAALPADLCRPDDCARLVARARHVLGGLDVLVNNAAVFQLGGLADTSEARWRDVWTTNLTAPWRLLRAFARHVSAGAVVNILDQRIAAHHSTAAAYQLSKKALADLTRLAALELAPRIAVNAIAPGPVLLPRRRAAREPAGVVPLQRRPTTADIAAALLFLLGQPAITGQIIFVDGGQHLLGSSP